MFFWNRSKRRDFSYIAEKIKSAPVRERPFSHVYIPDIFSEEHFRQIIHDPQIKVPVASSDKHLFELLHGEDFRELEFPGTTTDLDAYMSWHKDRNGFPVINRDTCEGFGVALRLTKARDNSVIGDLSAFLSSNSFWNALREKFSIDEADTYTDIGIQKYLDGYEISPHPDVRRKALTFMANINPSANSEMMDHHTHYMAFTEDRDYVRLFWEAHPDVERCWVPWSWCETKRQQTKNNSMVIFVPANDTIHAVRARYDHLAAQRTQIYGNLWFTERHAEQSTWQDIADVGPRGSSA